MPITQAGLFPLTAISPLATWRAWLADPATLARFDAKTYHRGPEQCWPWLAALSADGHGRFRAGSRATGTSLVIAAHAFAYHRAHGITPTDLHSGIVRRHRCDEAACVNPAHLVAGTATQNTTEYLARRHRLGGPLADRRGAAGRALAIRNAIRTTLAESPAAVEAAITQARHNGDPHRHQLHLLEPPPLPQHLTAWTSPALPYLRARNGYSATQ
jgi:hypothetical protein